MPKISIKITETLMLRRIDPITMLKKYLSGGFKNVTIPKNKIKITSSFVDLNRRIGTDQTCEIYRFNDKTNHSQVIVTTNHSNYQQVKDKTPKQINKCIWCRRNIVGKPIGIPVEMELNRHTKETIFHVEDSYCNHNYFQCVFAGLKQLNSCHHMYKDPIYMDSEQLLHRMYYKIYPDRNKTRIKEAKHWRMLDINGGPLSSEQYDSETTEYIEIPNLILLPCKRRYIQLTIK